MRVWDLHPGYLSRASLLGEHRELHAIASILKHRKSGYARHPETVRWRGHGWALRQRHRIVVAEMALRGYLDRTPVGLRARAGAWPAIYVDPPGEQLRLLAVKYREKTAGRIPLPRNPQQLWAQHKYSVMARSAVGYRRLGRWVSGRKDRRAMDALCAELVALLRQPPRPGDLKNALWHMWGYVSMYAPAARRDPGGRPLRSVLRDTQRLAATHDVRYLQESTALSDLAAWLR